MILERARLPKKLQRFLGDAPGDRITFARLLADKGDLDRAQREIEKVLAGDRNNLAAQRALAGISRQKADEDLFEKTLHRILVLDPEDKQAREDLLQIQALRGKPVDRSRGIVTQTLADIYAGQGYYLEAYDIFEELSRQEPGNPLYHERLADLKEKIMKGLSRRLKRSKKESPH